MDRQTASRRPLCLAVVLAAIATPAFGIESRVETESLGEVAPGERQFLARYTLSEVALETGQGIALRFDPARIVALELTPQGFGPDWDAAVVQPDSLLPDYGLFDLQAQTESPSSDGVFEVRFLWTGDGEPGPQSFVVYDTDFRSLEAGMTVPEPGALGMALASLTTLAALGRLRR